ncbi:hypothetical protein K469DRAFT_712004 [Zopfia rhizophila CBS 207.26]|uniref:Uncharacterized protein n=1 Tax=Zopfia rhizophila CBS 207.26 TaxID=1314779 RepID=A0A6A6DWR5_9PEZI|nr:hypothetical protein K469DRAFT_712004 [Zopfia rhizophila CBS 207.26]
MGHAILYHTVSIMAIPITIPLGSAILLVWNWPIDIETEGESEPRKCSRVGFEGVGSDRPDGLGKVERDEGKHMRGKGSRRGGKKGRGKALRR